MKTGIARQRYSADSPNRDIATGRKGVVWEKTVINNMDELAQLARFTKTGKPI